MEIYIYPLSFAEFTSVYNGTLGKARDDYFTYGGMPLILSRVTIDDKSEYLSSLFNKVYLLDIIERHNVNLMNLLISWQPL